MHETARVAHYGRAIVAAGWPVERAWWRAAERLVGRDGLEVVAEQGELRREVAGVRHEGAQRRRHG
jgi:hypothetical protein